MGRRGRFSAAVHQRNMKSPPSANSMNEEVLASGTPVSSKDCDTQIVAYDVYAEGVAEEGIASPFEAMRRALCRQRTDIRQRVTRVEQPRGPHHTFWTSSVEKSLDAARTRACATRYSWRKAIMGSTALARRAGR